MPAASPIVATRDRLAGLKAKIDLYSILEQRERCQDSLRDFVEAAWPHVDPSPFMSNWAIDSVCFPYDTKITTMGGIKSIGEIVETKWQGLVLSFNHASRVHEWKSIVSHFKSAGKPLLRIRVGDSNLLLTDNHPIYVKGRGYVRADQLKVGDFVGTYSQKSKAADPNQLQAMREAELCSALAKEGVGFLRDGLLQCFQSSSGKEDLSNVRRSKVVGRSKVLSKMLWKNTATWAVVCVQAVRQKGLEISSRIQTDVSRAWGILQQEVFWLSYAWKKPFAVYSWHSNSRLPNRVSYSAPKDSNSRQQLLFSMQQESKVIGCASYRSRQDKQFSAQFSSALSQLSSSAAPSLVAGSRQASEHNISPTVVNSIERCAWVPEAVYNIEVLDNHNYFAESILVHNCDHLEAVMLGQISNLLINIPPRCAKTTVVSIMYPAWIWLRYQAQMISPLSGPQVKFLCAGYSDKLTLLSSTAFRRLVESEWYQQLNPNLSFMRDQNTKSHMDNSKGGSRQSTSVGGSLLGLGGDILIADDLNNTETEKLVETGAERARTISFFNEFRSTRRNDPRPGHSAVVGVQQRTNEGDMSGSWLDSEDDITHLMIPMRHDSLRHSVTVVLPQYDDVEPWEDPRTEDNELMWPERFNEFAVAGLEKALGPYMASGRLQQLPSPKGGGIIQRDYWVPWGETEAAKYQLEWRAGLREMPDMELVVASLDTAYKEKEENDYNAFTIWGIFLDKARNRRAMLMYAWMKRLPLNGKVVSAFPHETKVMFEQRMKDNWGLVDWVADGCKRYKVKRLLIEDKSRGHDVANEIRRLHNRENWGVQLVNPVGDKISRAHSVIPLFTDDAIYAPFVESSGTFIRWADQVVTQCAKFPKDVHDDLVDSVTQFLSWARDNELLARADEITAANEEAAMFKHKEASVSEAYGVG